MKDDNLVLIGMPGAGKSTVGVILAKRIGFDFIDTDLLIQSRQKCRLQEIIDREGLTKFRQIEEQTLLELNVKRAVVATGGSVVYSRRGVESIRRNSRLIYLRVPLPELQWRIADMGERGLVMAPGQSFADLFYERTPLYQEYADITVECRGLNAEQVAARIEALLLDGQLDRWVSRMTE